jgi:hypothetical protein
MVHGIVPCYKWAIDYRLGIADLDYRTFMAGIIYKHNIIGHKLIV